MTEFTANNGVSISTRPPETDRGPWLMVDGHMVSPNDTQALREYFEHEEDEELKRVRWPENPNILIYRYSSDTVAVLNERTAEVSRYRRDEVLRITRTEPYSDYARAARWFFDSSPERKPWHEANPGEAWHLTIDGQEWGCLMNVIGVTPDLRFARALLDGTTEWFPITHPDIESGRRVWPEEAS